MTPLAPPTEAEVKEMRKRAVILRGGADFDQSPAFSRGVAEDVLALCDAYLAQREAALALYEEVEMAESVGICLPNRVPSLRLGAALSAAPLEDKP